MLDEEIRIDREVIRERRGYCSQIQETQETIVSKMFEYSPRKVRYILAMPPPRPLQIDSKTLMRQPLNCQTRQLEDVNPPYRSVCVARVSIGPKKGVD